jgi:type IV secretion system protein VirD4
VKVRQMVGFKDALLRDLPRGIAGKEDKDVAAAWGDVRALGPKWAYGSKTANGRRGVFLGYNGEGGAIGITDDRHILTIAGSRGGKGRSLVVPNLLFYEGSVLAIDPKGELARVTSRARAEMGQKVYVLDPFEASLRDCKSDQQRATLKMRFVGYNPLSELDPLSNTVVDDAAVIAGALIKDNPRDPHWTDSAKRLIRALILYVLWRENDKANLCQVRDLLMLKDHRIRQLTFPGKPREETLTSTEALWEAMQDAGDAFDGLVSATAETFSNMEYKELASVLSTALTQTEFLDSPALRGLLARNDFKLGDLKRGGVTVYLCLPAGRMASHANWLRVIIDLALRAFENEKAKPPAPVLVVLDEFPVLGYMKGVETAAGQIASFAVKLWTIVQDITQLQREYRASWQTFIGNAGVVTAFANTDSATLEYLSGLLGKLSMNVSKQSDASDAARRQGARTTQEQIRDAPLLAPHELALMLARQDDQRELDRILVKAAGQAPLILQRALYDKDEPFRGRFDL